MEQRHASQLNIRSGTARATAHELARRTGMTVTQVVEEALRAYSPPAAAPPGLAQRGALLVLPARGARVTLAMANAALDASRR
jgi:hypothetical protein